MCTRCSCLFCFLMTFFILCNIRMPRLFPYVNTHIIESRHDKNQQSDCAPSEDSDQPGHQPSLTRVFAVRMKKPGVLSYPLSAQQKLESDWAEPRLIRVFAGCTVTVLVLSHCSSYRLSDIPLTLH